MNIASPTTTPRRHAAISFAAAVAFACAPHGFAQQAVVSPAPLLLASNTLPDSPGAVLAKSNDSGAAETSTSLAALPGYDPRDGAPAGPAGRMASPTDKYIEPGESAPTITAKNKVIMGIRDAVSPFSALGWIVTAGYEQGTNGSPNYGTNSTAFAQRFGAAAARAVSEGIFTDSVMASVLHEDPRYYRLGSNTSFVKRTIYAATRTLITRTDSGRTTPNFALLAGNLGGSYLTKTYYPPLNQSNQEVLKTFGGSIGGSAIGFVVSEFFGDGFSFLHHKDPHQNP